jgi:Type IV secretion system proteins.
LDTNCIQVHGISTRNQAQKPHRRCLMKTDHKPRKARKAPFLTSIALACALASGNASAGIPVIDGTSLGEAIAEFVEQIAKWGVEAERWTSQWSHYTQQLTKLDQIFSQAQLAFGQQFQKRSETEGIDERCNGGSGNMLSDLISSFGLNMNGDIVAQQKALCSYIVIMQNKKYNDQVEAMNTLLQKTREDIRKQMLRSPVPAPTAAWTRMRPTRPPACRRSWPTTRKPSSARRCTTPSSPPSRKTSGSSRSVR